ncbi:hypothetical protein J6590_094372 [Homalodisca vitripennis]|nr:hypothetical protein J6590_094372 [Homalodisca vitripennis]
MTTEIRRSARYLEVTMAERYVVGLWVCVRDSAGSNPVCDPCNLDLYQLSPLFCFIRSSHRPVTLCKFQSLPKLFALPSRLQLILATTPRGFLEHRIEISLHGRACP